MAIIAGDLEPFVSLSFFFGTCYSMEIEHHRAMSIADARACTRAKKCVSKRRQKNKDSRQKKNMAAVSTERKVNGLIRPTIVRHRHLGPLDVSGSSAVAEGIGLGIVIVAQ